jgi:hypothetical protein
LNRSGKYINRRAIGLTFSETNLSSVERTGGKGKSFFYSGKEKNTNFRLLAAPYYLDIC